MVFFSCFMMLFCLSFQAQKKAKIPRKLRGIYLGFQPEYTFLQRGNDFHFTQLEMKIIVERQTVRLCYPKERFCPIEACQDFVLNKVPGSHGKRYAMQVRIPHGLIMEEWTFDVRRKEILRKGISPQPDTRLARSGKKE